MSCHNCSPDIEKQYDGYLAAGFEMLAVQSQLVMLGQLLFYTHIAYISSPAGDELAVLKQQELLCCEAIQLIVYIYIIATTMLFGENTS